MTRLKLWPLLILLSACTPRPVPPAAVTGNVVGVVGSVAITDHELLERIALIESQFPRKFSTHPQKFELLREMMNVELLYQEALAQGLDKSFEFKTRLADVYAKRLATEARAKITDEEVAKEYLAHPRVYDQISARHILLKFPPQMTRDQKKELLSKIEDIRKKAVESPDRFAEIAKQNSQDSSANAGGELGFFSYGMMVEPFSKAAFALKTVGEISPVVETQFGFHIIQLSGDRRDIKFSRDQIREALLRSSQRARLDSEVNRLKKGKKFEIYEQALIPLSPLPEIISKDPKETLKFKPQ